MDQLEPGQAQEVKDSTQNGHLGPQKPLWEPAPQPPRARGYGLRGLCGPGSLGYDPNEHTHRPRASPGLMKPPIKPIHVREASLRARRQRSFTNIARLARASHGPNGPAQLDLSSPDTH